VQGTLKIALCSSAEVVMNRVTSQEQGITQQKAPPEKKQTPTTFAKGKFHLIMCPPDTPENFCWCFLSDFLDQASHIVYQLKEYYE